MRVKIITFAVGVVLTLTMLVCAVSYVSYQRNWKAEQQKQAQIAATTLQRQIANVEAIKNGSPLFRLAKQGENMSIVKVPQNELPKIINLAVDTSIPGIATLLPLDDAGRPTYNLKIGASQIGHGDGDGEDSGTWDGYVTYDKPDVEVNHSQFPPNGFIQLDSLSVDVHLPVDLEAGTYTLGINSHYNDGGPQRPYGVTIQFKVTPSCPTMTMGAS